MIMHCKCTRVPIDKVLIHTGSVMMELPDSHFGQLKCWRSTQFVLCTWLHEQVSKVSY